MEKIYNYVQVHNNLLIRHEPSYTLYTVLYAGAPIYKACVQIVRLHITNRYKVSLRP